MISESSIKRTSTTQADQGLPNYTEALRLLRNAHALVEKRKKQIRVEAVRAHRGSWVEQEQTQRQKIRDESRMSNKKSFQDFQDVKNKQLQKIEQLRIRGDENKKESLRIRSKSRLESFQNKLRMKEEVRQKSQQHQEKLRQFRNDNLMKNKNRRLQLYNDLKSSREHVYDMNSSRVSQIRSTVSRERDELLAMIKRKKRELSVLNQEEESQIPSQKQQSSIRFFKPKTTDKLPYRLSSSHINNRRKSISQAKFDFSKRAIVYS